MERIADSFRSVTGMDVEPLNFRHRISRKKKEKMIEEGTEEVKKVHEKQKEIRT
jgi:hypothetical protein